jgi:hypothetical protein
MLLLFSMAKASEEPQAVPSYRVFPDGSYSREEGKGAGRRRWAHANREIERALDGLAIQGIHLQRNQMREILALKS